MPMKFFGAIYILIATAIALMIGDMVLRSIARGVLARELLAELEGVDEVDRYFGEDVLHADTIEIQNMFEAGRGEPIPLLVKIS